jgi:hypothetical protein
MVEIGSYKSLIEVSPRSFFRETPTQQEAGKRNNYYSRTYHRNSNFYNNGSYRSGTDGDGAYYSYDQYAYVEEGAGAGSGDSLQFCSYFRTKCLLCRKAKATTTATAKKRLSNHNKAGPGNPDSDSDSETLLFLEEEEQEVSTLVKECPCKSGILLSISLYETNAICPLRMVHCPLDEFWSSGNL